MASNPIIPQSSALERPWLRRPDPDTEFILRARRFEQLGSRTTSMAGYLRLMAELAHAQHHTLQTLLDHDTSAIGPTRDIACSPKISRSHLDPNWHIALDTLLRLLPTQPATVADALARLANLSTAELDSMARHLLQGEYQALNNALAPFLAAALQVHWARYTGMLEHLTTQPAPAAIHLCPHCGSLPVASIIETGGNLHGLRFLCCSLCTTQWNYPRIQCLTCASSQAVAYYGFEEQGDAVKAEACEDCKVYMKIVNKEKDVAVDPIADDIATLGLDVKMSDAGFSRYAVNPFLVL